MGLTRYLITRRVLQLKTRLVRLEKKTRPGERMGASSPSGLGGVRSGAPSQVPRHVAANGPAGAKRGGQKPGATPARTTRAERGSAYVIHLGSGESPIPNENGKPSYENYMKEKSFCTGH